MNESVQKTVDAILAKGDRVELIPLKDGDVKVIHIQRKEVKTKHRTSP